MPNEAPPAKPTTSAKGSGASYDQSAEQVDCGGRWVPAPDASQAAGGATPPAPVTTDAAAPAEATAPAADAAPVKGGPASALPTWPQWQQYFMDLGVSPTELDKIATAPLGNKELAKVYEQLHHEAFPELAAAEAQGPSSSKAPGAAGGASAWSPEWQQRFLDLGVPAEFVSMLQEQSEATGADDAKLASVYDQLAQVKDSQAAGTTAPASTDPAAVTDPAAAADTATAAAEQPGWTPEIEQQFKKLGMPDEVVQLYAQSGAPVSGLEAAYKHADSRLQDFKDRGWYDKFTEAKVDPVEMWSVILGDKPATDEDLQKQLDAAKNANMGMASKGAQLATSLFPGGRLAQYVMGSEPVSGEKIDRSSPMQIGMAALSGLSMFAAFKGAKSLGAGFLARGNNLAELGNVSATMSKLGLNPGEVEGVQQAAMGATQTWGAKQKIISMIPGTQLHKDVVGLGHAEAAAKAFNAGGAERLMQDPDGALQIATLTKLFDEVKSGTTRLQGGKYAYLPNFRKGAPMTAATTRDGQQVINVMKNLKVGDGRSQLASMLEVGGTRLGNDPAWLGNAPQIVDDVAARSDSELASLGKIMAGNAADSMGVGADGGRAVKYLTGLQQGRSPEWYSRLASHMTDDAPVRRAVAGGGVAPSTAFDATPAMPSAVQDAVTAGAARYADSAPTAVPSAATSRPVSVMAGADGRFRTPSGLEVPSFATSVTGQGPRTAEEAARLVSLERQLVTG